MCEYHYRKGVYEATMEPDSVEAQKYAADDDGYMTIRRFGKPTLQVKIGRDWRIHVDAQISTMHIVYCENLALYFRSSRRGKGHNSRDVVHYGVLLSQGYKTRLRAP